MVWLMRDMKSAFLRFFEATFPVMPIMGVKKTKVQQVPEDALYAPFQQVCGSCRSDTLMQVALPAHGIVGR